MDLLEEGLGAFLMCVGRLAGKGLQYNYNYLENEP